MNYYKILCIESGASEKEIHKAYIGLARQYHPDIKPGDAAALEKMKLINEAYEVLGNREKREEYDRIMNFNTSKNYAEYEEDEQEYKDEAEKIWKRAVKYYEESCASEKEEKSEIKNVKYKFSLFMTLPFIWCVAIVYMPYSILAAMILGMARYIELGENNIRQKKSTMITLLLLLAIGLVFLWRNKN